MNKKMQNPGDEQLLDAQELAQAFESTMHVVQGNHEAVPELLQNTGKILVKLSSRLSTTQMVLLVGALTLGAMFLVKRAEASMEEEASENGANAGKRKSLPDAAKA